MDIGISSPIMEPNVTRDVFRRWAEAMDEGPFSTYAVGERVAYPNPHVLAVLAASAAWTERVRLTSTVIVPALYDPVMLAKELASIDLLSQGRLSVGVGIGGHPEDYIAVNADLGRRTQFGLRQCVETMRRTWAGETVREGASAIGPMPARAGTIPILAGAMGPKAIRAAAQWADAVSGWSVDADVDGIANSFKLVAAAWEEAGRVPPPLITSFWYAVGEGAREQVDLHLKRYLMRGGALPEGLSKFGFAGSGAQLKQLLRRIEDLGADEVILATTGIDPDQVRRVADAIG
jgi:alkanesulfonate monooxygenase SsuD/methylene tetrahydromethanopterin reductase-like flavin-dependent oxidoreductase (luciferase family)